MTRRGAWSVAVGILPALLLSGALSAAEPVRNGFVLEPASIPAAEIPGGGPPRDGLLRARMDEWGRWRRDHPETTVLSRETGHRRDYDRTPYGGYARSRDLMFPVSTDRRYHPKMPTVGLRVPGVGARAYPASELARAGGSVEESFLNRTVRISYDADRELFDVDVPPEVEVIEGFWFAWAAFHPGTSVYISGSTSDQDD